ncbi:MAG: toll/interleukin-1 receptor domain-containing protein [Candidatus Margulisbacteria bacterium]|jgi:hypothetical protein|nr:toll/interleukin-1 receptor domain-containing protein [Candidatus Margulisiibacteriota bacterium]
MVYLSEKRLLAKSRVSENSHFSKSQLTQARYSVFLSHSHLDKEFVYGFEQELKEIGISAYIDWRDASMPTITDRKTADKIKNKIAENDLFMVLATKNALKSAWVPWEIGVADQTKGENKIFIIPVADDSGKFIGNEYLQLYNQVIISDNKELGVFRPNMNEGISLRKAILKGGYYE